MPGNAGSFLDRQNAACWYVAGRAHALNCLGGAAKNAGKCRLASRCLRCSNCCVFVHIGLCLLIYKQRLQCPIAIYKWILQCRLQAVFVYWRHGKYR